MNETFIGAGLTLIINENNNYSILMAKSNSKKEYKKNVWLFPGGRRNNTELPHQTAYREFIEEIFNVVVSDFIVNEIIDNISKDENLYSINTRISENSFTFIQSVDAIIHFVNVLNSHNIKSDVFPFGYDNLYDIDKKINIYQFCFQRKYINDLSEYQKNELVFITMIPLKNLLHSIYITQKYKYIYHYHGENLKLLSPDSIQYIEQFIKNNNS